jgi:hypothetical protein
MADPSSWLAVEWGWEVVGRDGKQVGHVERVLGEEDRDIFHGLAVAIGLTGPPRLVAAEHVERIVERRVTIDLTKDEVARLDPVE